MELIVKLCAGSSKTALLFLLIGVGLVTSTVGASKAEASTSYETAGPIQEQSVDFTGIGASDGNQRYVNRVRVPLGVTFDRLQVSWDNPNGIYPYIGTDGTDGRFEDCTDAGCVSGDSLTALTVSNTQTVGTDLIQYTFSTTQTITSSNQYFYLSADPNPNYSFGQNLVFDDIVWSENGYSQLRNNGGPAMRFCNGACDSSEFSPIPNATANPWVRLTAPASGSTQSSTVTLRIESNAGTSTADTITVRYLSNFQSIAPDVYSVNTSGIQPKTIVKSFPAINDTVQIEISMSTGSTTVVTSPTYSIRISDSLISDEASTENQVNCDSTSGIGWALCSTAVMLFVPSDASINRFTDVYETLSTKFPFAYLTDFRDSITSIYTGSTTASLGLTVPFGEVGDITLISADLVSDVPFTSTIRTILGALIWLMLASQIWRRGQTIFNQKTT